MPTYSFQDTVSSIVGPGIVLNVGYGAALSEEGIDITMLEDKNTMQIAADGGGQHNMHSGNAGTIVYRFLKTSKANALLMAAYNAQKVSASLWGKNIIVARNTASGDTHTGIECAFKKRAEVGYQKVGKFLEWTFDCIRIESILGIY